MLHRVARLGSTPYRGISTLTPLAAILNTPINKYVAELLQALQSSDNNVRSQAEDHLTTNWTNAKPEMLLMGLVEQIHGSNDTTVSRPCPISSIWQDVVEKQ
jgi:hypothetical protein